jgi:hypothetical protein
LDPFVCHITFFILHSTSHYRFFSDQLVTLETVTPHKKVRIIGLDESGYLLTMPDPRAPGDPDAIALDYTNNSFDMMGALIRRKC